MPVRTHSFLFHLNFVRIAASRNAFHLWRDLEGCFQGHWSSRSGSDGILAYVNVSCRLCVSAFAAKNSRPFIQTEHCHLYLFTPTHSSIHLFSPLKKTLQCPLLSGVQFFFLIHPTLFSQTIYLHMLVCPFTYFYKWIHMFLSSAFPPQVGFHINHNLILHRQLGCLPNSSEDGGADRVGGRPGRSDGDRVWYHARRINNDFLPGQRLLMSLHEKHYLCS